MLFGAISAIKQVIAVVWINMNAMKNGSDVISAFQYELDY